MPLACSTNNSQALLSWLMPSRRLLEGATDKLSEIIYHVVNRIDIRALSFHPRLITVVLIIVIAIAIVAVLFSFRLVFLLIMGIILFNTNGNALTIQEGSIRSAMVTFPWASFRLTSIEALVMKFLLVIMVETGWNVPHQPYPCPCLGPSAHP